MALMSRSREFSTFSPARALPVPQSRKSTQGEGRSHAASPTPLLSLVSDATLSKMGRDECDPPPRHLFFYTHSLSSLLSSLLLFSQ